MNNTVTPTWIDLPLLPHHVEVLSSRGVTVEVARAHGYRSSTGEPDLRRLGYRGTIAKVSGALVIPLHDADGDVTGYQIRPDDEIAGDKPGSVLKYVSPAGQPNVIDVPVSIGARGNDAVRDPATPLLVTEGPLKAAAAASRGIPCVSIQGVSSYVGTATSGGRGVYLSDWRSFAKNRAWIIGYDSDAMSNPDVLKEARRLGAYLGKKDGASVSYLLLPGDVERKVGLDDWLVSNPDATPAQLYALAVTELPDLQSPGVDPSDTRDLVPATDLDVSDAYVGGYGDRVRYLTDLGKWVGYSDGRWDLSGGDSVARSNAQDLFRTIHAYRLVSDGQGGTRRVDATDWLYQAARIDSCLAQVRSNRRMQARADDLNRMPMLLNVANGTVELVTGTLGPHDPRDLLTQKSEVKYDPESQCPEFLKFVGEVLPDSDVRGFVQRLFGMALLGEVRDHVFTVFTGTGRNGKGVLLRIAQSVFGDYATGVNKDLLVKTNFDGHPTHLATLYGRRLAVAQELERGAKWDVSRVKELTGGDAVTARWMRGNDFTFTPSHTLIMASNHRPGVGEGERAFWARYREVPFTVSFEGREDVTLADRIIDNELPGVLQWMLQGLRDYLSDGLGNPDAVVAASRDAQEESDPLLRFVHERLELTGNSDDRLPTREVWDAWNQWAATEGDHISRGSYLRFGRSLSAATPALTTSTGRHGDLAKVARVDGVRWRSESDQMRGLETSSAGVAAGVNAGVVQTPDQQVSHNAGVAGVNPEIVTDVESSSLVDPSYHSISPLTRYTPVTPATPANDLVEVSRSVTRSYAELVSEPLSPADFATWWASSDRQADGWEDGSPVAA